MTTLLNKFGKENAWLKGGVVGGTVILVGNSILGLSFLDPALIAGGIVSTIGVSLAGQKAVEDQNERINRVFMILLNGAAGPLLVYALRENVPLWYPLIGGATAVVVQKIQQEMDYRQSLGPNVGFFELF